MTTLNPDAFENEEAFKEALNADGLKRGWTLAPTSENDELTQGEKTTKSVLAHVGVKGMRWGVRRDRSSKVTVVDKGKRLKTKGGHGLPADSSAVRARVIGQKGKKSGLKSLTDQELQDYAKRIQMEQNVSRLMFNEKSRGAQFVDKMIGRKGSQLADKAAQEGATRAGRSALNAATRKSAKVARIAAFA